jgi:hypothetical protein
MGIKQMQKRQEERENSQTEATRELWLKDGDQAFLTILTDEKEDEEGNYVDNLFSSYFVRRQNITTDTGKVYPRKFFVGEKWDDIPDEYVAQKVVSEQIGFWAYVYYVLHEKRNDKVKGNEEWKEEKAPGGSTRFKEEVNDFKIYLGGLGQKRSFEGELNGIYNDVGSLDGMVCRLSKTRTGKMPTDIVYNIRETTKKSVVPKEKKDEIASLPFVLNYVKEHLVEWKKETSSSNVTDEGTTFEQEVDEESLF